MNQQDFALALKQRGALIVGFGDLSVLTASQRQGMPVGICVAVKYPPEVIRGIAELPTEEYHTWYNKLNTLLDSIVSYGAQSLQNEGYRAIAMTRERVGKGERNDNTVLPYKTLATRAGIGWIGKSALLINAEYGSAIRLSGILTDAPFKPSESVNTSECGSCVACVESCPANAITGKTWAVGIERNELVDAPLCRKVARERAGRGFGRNDVTICGKCIEVCPHTRKYLKGREEPKTCETVHVRLEGLE